MFLIKGRLLRVSFNLFLCSSVLLLSACATTHKGKVFESMAIGAVVGGLYGASRSEFKHENAALYGSMGAAAGAAYAEFTGDIDKENQKKLEAFNELEETLNKSSRDSISRDSIFNGSAVVSPNRIPPKLKKVLNHGNLTGFKADEWIDWGENRAAHIDEIWELNPAEFNLENKR